MARKSANAPFLRNAWYVAAWSEELDSGLMGRTIMNEPIAIFRNAEGKVCAVEDRCCHRGAALTAGKVVENGLQCGYHGLVFDGDGKCVEIPGQDMIPSIARVKAYPVVEKQEFIWIWMGDPKLATPETIVDWPIHDQPEKYPHRKAVMPIKANSISGSSMPAWPRVRPRSRSRRSSPASTLWTRPNGKWKRAPSRASGMPTNVLPPWVVNRRPNHGAA